MYVAAFICAGFLVAVALRGRACCAGGATATTASGFLLPFTIAAIAIADPDGRRRLVGARDLQRPADQVRGARAQHHHRVGQARDPPRAPERGRHRERRASRSPDLASWLERSRQGTDTVVTGPRLGAARGPARRCRHEHRPPGVGHDGRPRHGPHAARAVVRGPAGGGGATGARRHALVPARGGRRAGRRLPVRSSRAGSSPRSGASPGSSTRSCAPRTRSPTRRRAWCGPRSPRCSCSTPRWPPRRVLVIRGDDPALARGRGRRRQVPYGPREDPRAPPTSRAASRERRRRLRCWCSASASLLYALLGGADFGAGFWDLTAGGGGAGRAPRALIDRSIGPVWEANHVWLIFCIVVLWTAFPPAFSAVFSTLVHPADAGRARASCCAARASPSARSRRAWAVRRVYGATFALARCSRPSSSARRSGAIASGRVPPGNAAGDLWTSWFNPSGIAWGRWRSPCAPTWPRST